MKEFAVARALLPLLRGYPWALPAIVVLGMLSSLAEGIGISLFVPLLQAVDRTGAASPTGNWLFDSLSHLFDAVPADDRLVVIASCLFASVLLRASLAYGNTALFAWLDARISHRLRSSIYQRLLTVNYSFLERSKTGRLLNALTTETWRTSEALSSLMGFIVATCTFVVYISLLLLVSWQLTLLVAGAMVLISQLVRLITGRVERLGRKGTQASAALTQRMVEGVNGMKVIRAFGRESYEQERLEQISERVSRLFMRLRFLSGAVIPVYELLAAMLLVSVLLSPLQTAETLPILLVFVFILYRLQPNMKALDAHRVSLASLQGAVAEVTSLLDRKDEASVASKNIPCHGLREQIRYADVTFRYDPSERPALRNVSIEIPAGRTVALVGPSGSGKSTLINLLLRLYDVTEGAIYVDEQPIRDLSLASWRSRIAVVSQQVDLFNATVGENIAYGRLEATKDEIVAAARQAHAHEFIEQFPQGYDTEVGDRGLRLSGGQQQRIALARAIVRDPQILVLDEATSAVDSISEHLIQEALDTLSDGRTVIMIAHRLSTIERAHHIIVLEDGRVREEGDFLQLLEGDGLFAKMYRLQYRRALN